MALSPRRPIRPVGCRGDEHGQMMVLSAVVLVVSFVALAAMVGRVNQLGSQTATESRKVILDEVGPLADSMNSAIRSLGGSRTLVTTVGTAIGSGTITAASGSFFAEDVGRHITGTNIPVQAYIVSYQSSTTVTISPTVSSAVGVGITLTLDRFTSLTTTTLSGTTTITTATAFFTSADVGKALTHSTGSGLLAGTRIATVAADGKSVTVTPTQGVVTAASVFNIGDFALSSTTTPTLESAVVGMLEQMQNLVSSRGLWMDYEVECGVGADLVADTGDDTLASSTAVFRLFDGQVWLMVSSTATFTRTTACATDPGTELPN